MNVTEFAFEESALIALFPEDGCILGCCAV
jgi:hypothetical protein